MKTLSISSSLHFLFFVIIFSCFLPSHSHIQPDYFKCLDDSGVSRIIYIPSNSSYSKILYASIENLRFTSPSTPKPLMIFTPEHEHEVQAIVVCSKQHGIEIRTRSGGHDYEGVSYASQVPFVIIDLFKQNKVTIDVTQKTAWVEAGATLGQLYYEIHKVSQTLAFPGGFCFTVGVGGHFAGGGYGQLFRKYGLAADNVVDARLIDVNGKVFDREAMGEDLFWAIRGGGGGSFGVITAWKVKLVYVPQVITMHTVYKTLDQNAAELIHKWQYIGSKLPDEIYSSIRIRGVNSGEQGGRTIQAMFETIFLGGVDEFLELFAERFPELEARREDCVEVSWIQSILLFNGYTADVSPEVLVSRTPYVDRLPYKVKLDQVQKPIPFSGFEGLWNFLYEPEAEDHSTWLLLVANGGIMYETPDSALPYPFRAGYLYEIQYRVSWDVAKLETSDKYIDWIRRMYDYMTPFVSEFPRGAYVNYRDLDLGVNEEGGQIPTWGFQYFKTNFLRLMSVKAKVDPDNYFRHEQSIPPTPINGERTKEDSNLLKAMKLMFGSMHQEG